MSPIDQVRVDLEDRSYEITIGSGLLDRIGPLLREQQAITSSVCLVISDRQVHSHGYVDRVVASLRAVDTRVEVALVDAGESSKSFAVAERLYDAAFAAGLDRKSVIVAVGGGVIGDLAGFVAATYMRGIAFVQVPTTILAHDSSVGGKVAINHPTGKNVIGAFHQPVAVIYDVDTLSSLPPREVRSGMAEVVKHGAIWDVDFFEWLENNVQGIGSLERHALIHMLVRGCRVKAAVVSEDERESGLRAILNFGHTLGHAIEALSGYESVTHGEGVSIGMVFAAELSLELGLCASDVRIRLENMLTRLGLPTRIPRTLVPEQLLQSMYKDKKVVEHTLTFVLIEQIGKVRIVNGVDETVVLHVLHRMREAE